MHYKQLTAIIHKEAVELFFECASKEEIIQRYYGDTYISSMEIAFG